MPSLIDKPRLMQKLKSFHDYVRKNDGQIGTFAANLSGTTFTLSYSIELKMQ